MTDQTTTDGSSGRNTDMKAKRSLPPLLGGILVIALFLGLIAGVFVVADVAVAKETVEKGHGKYLTLAREAGVACPAIAGRIPEFAGDGYVTIDELEVVKTLLDLERAKPGGMKACTMRLTWHA